MKTRFNYFKTGALCCSLMVAPYSVPLTFAKPDGEGQSKSKVSDKAKKAEAGASVAITVKGLACPFCVHGLGKKLKKLKGVQAVDIQLKTGVARVTFDKGVKPDQQALREAIKKAGFTAGEIKASSKGKVK